MYICIKCGAKFFEPDRAVYARESWDCCPECGCPDFEAAAECVCCGEAFTEGDLFAGLLCKECLDAEPFLEDYQDFAHDPQVIDCFAEFMAERYRDKWKRRRLKPYIKEVKE